MPIHLLIYSPRYNINQKPCFVQNESRNYHRLANTCWNFCILKYNDRQADGWWFLIPLELIGFDTLLCSPMSSCVGHLASYSFLMSLCIMHGTVQVSLCSYWKICTKWGWIALLWHMASPDFFHPGGYAYVGSQHLQMLLKTL